MVRITMGLNVFPPACQSRVILPRLVGLIFEFLAKFFGLFFKTCLAMFFLLRRTKFFGWILVHSFCIQQF